MTKKIPLLITGWLLAFISFAQQTIPLKDFDAFQPTKRDEFGNWFIGDNVEGDFTKVNDLHLTPGATANQGGILICVHQHGKYGEAYNLATKMEHGDLDLDIDFMMAKGSNSGIYFQGRYEVQLFDSWGVQHPKFGDCGGIYERWNDSQPEGKKGFEGTAPRINVAKAPGLWQHLKISFQAPRFDGAGNKIANAKFLYVILNGVLIHENVEVTGPTRSDIPKAEVPLGPLVFQGDHSSVALRNINYQKFNNKPLTFSELRYAAYKGAFKSVADFEKLKPQQIGNMTSLNWSVSNAENEFAVKYAGKIKVPEAGKYTFTADYGGIAQVKINGQEILKQAWHFPGENDLKGSIDLPAGEVPFEMYYWKSDAWLPPMLGLYAESPTIRKHPLHYSTSAAFSNPVSPIIVETEPEPVILRSFMDIKNGDKTKRVVHAVSVGNKENIHFTYDLDNGSLFQVWKGGFLNATPMWHDRGDGSSRPLGSVLSLNDLPNLVVLDSPEKSWTEKVDASFRPKGYELDEAGQPTFMYEIYGGKIADKITPSENNNAFKREISAVGTATNLYCRIAEGLSITKNENGTYTVGDKNYYVRVNDGTATIRDIGGKQELIVPVNGKISYTIIW